MDNDEIVNVRYMVDDVEASIAFYTELLGFEVLTNAAPAFADVKRGNLRLLLSGPKSSAGRPMADGATPGPGGWNRIHYRRRHRRRGRPAPRRRRHVSQRHREGPGGKQILLQDPSGNFVELFQPAAAERRDGRATATRSARHDRDVAAAPRRARRRDRRRRSMIGAGVFSAWGPATDAAGTGVLIGLVVAAAVAFCNATSSAQLAAVHPESGGTYVYARRQLGPVVGLPRRVGIRRRQDRLVRRHRAHRRRLPVARPRPARRRRRGRRGGDRQPRRVDPHRRSSPKACSPSRSSRSRSVVIAGWSTPDDLAARTHPVDTSPAGVLRAGGFLFFAFAGYARIATLGEEVRDPATTIPKAIPRALAACSWSTRSSASPLLAALPIDAIAASDAPLGLVVSASPFDWLDAHRPHRRRHRRARSAPQPHPRRLPHRARHGPPPRAPALARDDRRPPLAPPARRGRRHRRGHRCSPRRSTFAAPSASPASPSSPTTRSPTPPA